MLTAFRFLAAYWPFIVPALVGAGALGFAAWTLSRWKAAVAALVLVAAVLAAGAVYKRGVDDQAQRFAEEQQRLADERVARIRKAAAADQARAAAAAADAAELRRIIDATPANADTCGDDGLADRLRRIR